MKVILASMLDKSQAKVAPILRQTGITSALCIPTAANVYAPDERDWQTNEMNALRALGITLDVFDLEGKAEAEVVSKLALHQAIYVTGGNTYFLLEHMQRSGFTQAIQQWLGEDKVYIGCSAGAAVACPQIDYIGKMDDPNKATLTSLVGLGLYPNLIMVHADHPTYGPIAQDLMAEWRNKGHKVIALNDDEALLYDGKTGQLL